MNKKSAFIVGLP